MSVYLYILTTNPFNLFFLKSKYYGHIFHIFSVISSSFLDTFSNFSLWLKFGATLKDLQFWFWTFPYKNKELSSLNLTVLNTWSCQYIKRGKANEGNGGPGSFYIWYQAFRLPLSEMECDKDGVSKLPDELPNELRPKILAN